MFFLPGKCSPFGITSQVLFLLPLGNCGLCPALLLLVLKFCVPQLALPHTWWFTDWFICEGFISLIIWLTV